MRHRSKSRTERREQAHKRLGTRDPSCTVCGEHDPLCLERHHLAGKKYHDDTAIVCRNCHRKLTDQQLDHISLNAFEPQGQMVVIGLYLLGLADLLAGTSVTLNGFGRELLENEEQEKTEK